VADGDGDTLLGLLLLALTAVPVVRSRLARRRRSSAMLRSGRLEQVPSAPETEEHPSRPRTFELRLGAVDASGTWRPRGVEALMGRNGLILAVDLVALAGLAALGLSSDDPPAAWSLVLAVAGVGPLASAVAALGAMRRGPSVDAEGPSRRDAVAAWLGLLVLAGTFAAGWLILALNGLTLVLRAG
jgi:hypothetical protein